MAAGGKTCAKVTITTKQVGGSFDNVHITNPHLKSILAPLTLWNPETIEISLPVSSLDSVLDKTKHLSEVHSSLDKPAGAMHQDDLDTPLAFGTKFTTHMSPPAPATPPPEPKLEWDWAVEHADRKRETKADAALHGALPFLVDRKLLKDVVREKMGVDVGRITFLSSGTFHKAYLITLVDKVELVARVARRFVPRLKTESEVATMHYLREYTNVPVPTIYHYDSNPYNRLGGEFILMSKAPGIPLSKVYHSMAYKDLVKLVENLAAIVIPLFSHRFPKLGSLYAGPSRTTPMPVSPLVVETPKASEYSPSSFPFTATPSMTNLYSAVTKYLQPKFTGHDYHVGPIISWPFFGSGRGDLSAKELDRGPWSCTQSYFAACARREISGVIRENEGRAAPHRLHLDPDEIHSSRHHHLNAVPGDRSDDSDEYDLEESEEEWEGPGDVMYRDYRRMQRTTFLIAHLTQREERVRRETERWKNLMERLLEVLHKDKKEADKGDEEFGLECHDLSLENVFVDSHDNTRITCIIDWESTTTRPLWACAHIPACLQSSPFMSNLFRQTVAKMAATPSPAPNNVRVPYLAALAREWLFYESAGVRLRMAHRFVEWDGWEEGLAESMLGPEDLEEEWFKDLAEDGPGLGLVGVASPPPDRQGEVVSSDSEAGVVVPARRKTSSKLPFAKEKEKEQMLNTTGDICGGRGGELGRRLEAWLTVGAGVGGGRGGRRRWAVGDEGDDREYEAEGEAG